jgi:ADP-heptose:LPS heptosyltransferase
VTTSPPSQPAANSTQSSLLDWSKVRRVLLIRLRSIGDTVLMTPCLSALKTWRPDIETTVLLEDIAAPLLNGHDLVDRLILSPRTSIQKFGLIRELRSNNFDIAFNLHGGTTGAIIAALSGARYTVGYAGYRWSRLLTARAPAPDVVLGKTVIHSVEQQLALLKWAGVPWPESIVPRLSVCGQARASIKERLALLGMLQPGSDGAGYAVVSPAASAASKRWGTRSFALVAQHLYDFWRLKSLIIAGKGEEHIAQQVAADAGDCARVLSGLTLSELVALISEATAFVGNDSGPMHIAAARRTPMVAIFGSSNLNVWRPWSRGPSRVLSPATVRAVGKLQSTQSSFPERDRENSGAFEGASKGESLPIDSVQVGDVIKAMDEVMEESLCSAGDAWSRERARSRSTRAPVLRSE